MRDLGQKGEAGANFVLSGKEAGSASPAAADHAEGRVKGEWRQRNGGKETRGAKDSGSCPSTYKKKGFPITRNWDQKTPRVAEKKATPWGEGVSRGRRKGIRAAKSTAPPIGRKILLFDPKKDSPGRNMREPRAVGRTVYSGLQSPKKEKEKGPLCPPACKKVTAIGSPEKLRSARMVVVRRPSKKNGSMFRGKVKKGNGALTGEGRGKAVLCLLRRKRTTATPKPGTSVKRRGRDQWRHGRKGLTGVGGFKSLFEVLAEKGNNFLSKGSEIPFLGGTVPRRGRTLTTRCGGKNALAGSGGQFLSIFSRKKGRFSPYLPRPKERPTHSTGKRKNKKEGEEKKKKKCVLASALKNGGRGGGGEHYPRTKKEKGRSRHNPASAARTGKKQRHEGIAVIWPRETKVQVKQGPEKWYPDPWP